MSKLEAYLKKIEENKANAEKTEKKSVFLPDLNEDFEFRTMTRSEKRDLKFNLGFEIKCMQDVFSNPKVRKIIYDCCELAQIADEAKKKGLIKSYYDIIDMLFSPDDLIELWSAILDANDLDKASAQKQIQEEKIEVNDLKN